MVERVLKETLAPTFPLINVVGAPRVGVLIEVVTSPIESHRLLLSGKVLQQVLKEGRKIQQLDLDIVRTIEKSKL